jgi:hypothetical protein
VSNVLLTYYSDHSPCGEDRLEFEERTKERARPLRYMLENIKNTV